VRHCGTMIGLRPDITEAHVVRHGVLRLTFADDLVGEVDVLDRMHGLVFDTARTTSGFAHVSVDEETGTVTWPGARISRRTPSMSAFGPVCGRIRRVTSYCDGRRSNKWFPWKHFGSHFRRQRLFRRSARLAKTNRLREDLNPANSRNRPLCSLHAGGRRFDPGWLHSRKPWNVALRSLPRC